MKTCLNFQSTISNLTSGFAFVLLGAVAAQAVPFTWTEYDNPTAGGATVETWGDNANWAGGNVFVSGASNELIFFADTSTRLEQEGSIAITGVPSALSMNRITLNGRGPNNPLGTAAIIGDGSSTWSIGDGTTSIITQNSTSGGGGDRYLNYTIAPNIVLNQTTTTFTGNGGGPQGLVFSGDISEATAGNGITKSGNHVLILSGNNTYTGTTNVTGGTLRLLNSDALPGGTGLAGGTSALTLNGGTLELGAGDFSRSLGLGSDQFQITGGTSGFSAFGGNRTITVGNDSNQELVWGSPSFNPGNLVLNQSTADSTITLANGIDLAGSTRTIQVNGNTAFLPGVIRSSSGSPGLNKTGGGALFLTNSNTYTGATSLNGGTLSIETADNIGVGGDLNLNNGVLEIRGTTLTSLTQLGGLGHTVNITSNGSIGFDVDDKDNTFTADLALNNGGNGNLVKRGAGTLILDQANTFGGDTTVSGGGTLVLDFTTQDNSKISPTSNRRLNISNTELILRGGTHAQTVGSTSLTNFSENGDGGGHTHISRDGGTATINLGSISRSSRDGATISFAEDGIATTSSPNNSSTGILGGWATVGSNWAKNSTNGTNGPIVGLTSAEYTNVTTSANSGSDNLQLTGSQALTGGITGNTLRIVSSGNDNVLDINSRNLRISRPNGEGGLLYAGGGNGNYTITGTTGNLNPQNGNQVLNINVHSGRLNLDVQVLPGGSVNAPLFKSGEGTLALGSDDNNYVGRTFLNQGTLLVNGDQSDATGDVIVSGGILGGTGTIGGDVLVYGQGSVSPGDGGTGVLTLNNTDLSLETSSASLVMEIDGTGTGEFDQIAGIDTFFLDGELIITTADPFNSETFELFDFNSVIGDFDAVTINTETLAFDGDIWSNENWEFAQSSGLLTSQAIVPEPAAIAIWSILGIMAFRFYRVRRESGKREGR